MRWKLATQATRFWQSDTAQRFHLSIPSPWRVAGYATNRTFSSPSMATTRSNAPLVWIDCEMTGLNPSTDSILSLACFVTDDQLQKMESNGFEAIIHHDPRRLDGMDDWCTKTHGESGLTAACVASTTTAEQAAAGLLAYIQQHVPEPGTALLAGNSIHADKSFLVKAPYDQAIQHLHYRLFDVSAIKEAMRRWAPESVLAAAPRKQNKHTAREDIEESIREAKYYQSLFEKIPGP